MYAQQHLILIIFQQWLNSIPALLDYDDRIIKYGADLLHNIAATSGHPVHANEEFHWFSLDVIGDLALAKSFNMLVDKKWHHAILLMNDFMWLLGPFSPVPWLARIGICLPGMARGWNNFVKWCKDRMEDRILVSLANHIPP